MPFTSSKSLAKAVCRYNPIGLKSAVLSTAQTWNSFPPNCVQSSFSVLMIMIMNYFPWNNSSYCADEKT